MLLQSLSLSAGFGGMRNLWGCVIASAFLVLLPEALRFVGMPSGIAANMRQIIYGGVLVFMMWGLTFKHV